MITAWVSQSVLNAITNEANRTYPLETGGCLLGYRRDDIDSVVIIAFIGPGPKAKHKRYAFKPDGEWQAKEIEKIYNDSKGYITYLGDWHSHPGGNAALSWKDLRTLCRIARCKNARATTPLMGILSGLDRWNLSLWQFTPSSKWLFWQGEQKLLNIKLFVDL